MMCSTNPVDGGPAERAQFYRMLVEQTLDVITVVDEHGNLLFKNPASERILGYAHAETEGRNVFDFIHPEDLDRVRLVFKNAVRTGVASPIVEHRYRHKDGTWRTFESVGRFSHHFSRGLVGIINSRDITHRKLLEHKVQQAQKVEALGLMAAGMVHDFNELLMLMLGETELLGGQESNVIDYVHRVRPALERASALTRRLLAFARQRQSGVPVSLDVNDALHGLMPMIQLFAGRGVIVRCVLDAAFSVVRIDRYQFDEMVLNIAANARDAMQDGGTLTVSTSNVVDSQSDGVVARRANFVAIDITDTGVGMSAEVRARLFEPFFTTKPPDKGTGLGLYSVYNIVSAAGGRVDVSSEPGRTTFRLLLPV